ncbi:MAG: WD40/YVTN/BNR-like repeat-containing protein [Actinomycetota bacterium]
MFVVLVGLVITPALPSAGAARSSGAASVNPLAVLRATANHVGMGDPDLPPVGRHLDGDRYLALRARQEALYRGAPFTLRDNGREVAIRQLRRERATAGRGKLIPLWTPIGPAPIPNGQTNPINAVSGRVTAIVVSPAASGTVYVGTAQGGLYRSTNGGATWTPMMDDAASLAIGALALSHGGSTLYVGTGEGNLSGDSYAGVGLYRIDNPAGAFTVHGPFETRIAGTGTTAGNGHAFKFESITGIAVDPANAARIYVSSTPGGIGVANDWECCVSPAASVGLYRSTNATSGTPTFTKVAGGFPQGSASTPTFFAATDVRFVPGSSSTLLVGAEDIAFNTISNNGVWRTTNANLANPTFKHVSLPKPPFNVRFGTSGTTVIVGAEAFDFSTNSIVGRAFKSTNRGLTFPTTLKAANGFCDFQCGYDMAVALDPSNASHILLGGSANQGASEIVERSTNGGSTFSSSDNGLHADTHAVAYAPSNHAVVYTGDDGGIFRSADGGATWTSRNTTGFSATQFQSIAVHPTDPNFTIGGTQDNGTVFYRPDASWHRIDFGDGGFSAIDQNAADNTNVTMYHTYFNEKSFLVGYAFVTTTATAHDGAWGFRGCSDGIHSGNGILCTENPLFYAPLELGPGSPNTVYFGTDRLHRSTNRGLTNPTASQTFSTTSAGQGRISAIGISPQFDPVRIVGGSRGGVFGTTTGANPLRNLDPTNTIPNRYVARTVIDPNTSTTAYVSINGFLGGTAPSQSHVWKTTNLNANPPTWTAVNTGLPDVPVNAFVVDPANSNDLYAGTDIGVFASTDGGTTWAPYGTGLPVVAVFDMAIAQPGTVNEVLRVGTHGKGAWEIPVA